MKSIFLIIVSALFLFGCNQKTQVLDLSGMDKSVSPAEDFYLYVNGTWMKNTTIPESESRWGVGSILRDKNKEALKTLLTKLSSSTHKGGTNAQKVGDFYKTAMDSAQIEKNALEPLTKYFNDINSIKNIDDVLRITATQQKMGSAPLFAIFSEADFKNSSINTVYAFQAGLGMPDRDYYLKEGERFEKYRNEYAKHLVNIFKLLGNDTEKAEASKNTVINIETELAKASWTRTEIRNLQAWYNTRTFKEAKKETKNIDWEKHFKNLGVNDLEYFVLAQPKFFKKVSSLLKSVNINDWKTYLTWHLINSKAPYLNEAFVKQDFSFFQTVLRGTKELKPRWKRAAEATDGALGEALGQLYVEKYFPPEAKAKANRLVNDLREAYRNRIKNLDWMSEQTKEQAFAKLDKMIQKIGYPDKWRDYSALEINDDAYVTNVIRANEFEFDRAMKKIGKPVDKTEWGMSPPTVNAYFHPLNNEIVFPAGILQSPMFNPEADDAVNYGAIGTVIGHEITHGFDDQGSLFDANGNMSNWWTDDDKKQFADRTKVIEEQFDDYTVLDSVHVKGKLTLGENIADLGGLSVAYDALQLSMKKNGRPEKIDGFTAEQRFFLSYASIWRNKYRDDALLNLVQTDPHSPPHLRTNGPLSNMPQFFEAFDVKAGDKMRRSEDKIAKVW